MLTNQDITKIINAHKKVFATREEIVTKEDFVELKKDFRSLQTSVDGLANTFKKYYEEQKILVHRVQLLEEWVKKAAGKLGVEAPF